MVKKKDLINNSTKSMKDLGIIKMGKYRTYIEGLLLHNFARRCRKS